MAKRKSSTAVGAPTPAKTSRARPAKKARTSAGTELTIDEFLDLTKEKLETVPQETLVNYILDLQNAYREIESALSILQAQPAALKPSLTKEAEDPDKIEKQIEKLADMMSSGIKKQMKWQPSCKTGGKQWTYSAMVPSEAVFYKLFNMQEPKKAWKQKKISLGDFQAITGYLEASIRYGSLRITSNDITLKWDKDEGSFAVSGLYGLSVLGPLRVVFDAGNRVIRSLMEPRPVERKVEPFATSRCGEDSTFKYNFPFHSLDG
ncbi:hypothetical protein G7Y89_g3965 [Cudoniella acicularis]|uniref:Uncharacterized protein n=1 Tax=Cudoniella acicularis TaxID=354080 RepID=A0A8H4RSI3_9HELO|nr:hypothetical protein G7Y89_g3965 [Cudoniella acicularis]